MSDLRERVARALAIAMGQNPDEQQGDPYCESDNGSWPLWAEYQKPADAAIALVLEEAARVADATTAYDDNVQKSAGCATTGQRIAAAIRAMKGDANV